MRNSKLYNYCQIGSKSLNVSSNNIQVPAFKNQPDGRTDSNSKSQKDINHYENVSLRQGQIKS